MTAPRGWALPESHLLPDVVVAFVDGELSHSARDRAASHITRCTACAAEVRAQLGASGKGGNTAAAALSGKRIAEKAKAAGIEKVAFDRSGFAYHGRVKALADAAREAGLQF